MSVFYVSCQEDSSFLNQIIIAPRRVGSSLSPPPETCLVVCINAQNSLSRSRNLFHFSTESFGSIPARWSGTQCILRRRSPLHQIQGQQRLSQTAIVDFKPGLQQRQGTPRPWQSPVAFPRFFVLCPDPFSGISSASWANSPTFWYACSSTH